MPLSRLEFYIGFGLLLLWVWSTRAEETLKSCQNKTSTVNMTGIPEVISNITVDHVTYVLLKSTAPVNWCDAYWACKRYGHSLGVLSTPAFRKMRFEWKESIEFSWIAGRRKDNGEGWSWLDEEVTPFKNLTLNGVTNKLDKEPVRLPYATLFSGSVRSAIQNVNVESAHFICNNKDGGDTFENNQQRSWYHAQNQCFTNGGHLATWDEIRVYLKNAISETRNYWIGLYYRPWLWIGVENVSPILQFPWLLEHSPDDAGGAGSKDCLSTLAAQPDQWQARSCADISHFYICQREVDEEQNYPWNVVILVMVGMVVFFVMVIAIIVTCGRTTRRKVDSINSAPEIPPRPRAKEPLIPPSNVSSKPDVTCLPGGLTNQNQMGVANNPSNSTDHDHNAMIREMQSKRPRLNIESVYYSIVRNSGVLHK